MRSQGSGSSILRGHSALMCQMRACRASAAIEGDAAESGPGDMLVLWNSRVGGDVCERGPGTITVDATSELVGSQAC